MSKDDKSKNNIISFNEKKAEKAEKGGEKKGKEEVVYGDKPIFLAFNNGSSTKKYPNFTEFFINIFLECFNATSTNTVSTSIKNSLKHVELIDFSNSYITFNYTPNEFITTLLEMGREGVFSSTLYNFNKLLFTTKTNTTENINTCNEFCNKQLQYLITNSFIKHATLHIYFKNNKYLPLLININLPNEQYNITEIGGEEEKLKKTLKRVTMKYNKICKHVEYLKGRVEKLKKERDIALANNKKQ